MAGASGTEIIEALDTARNIAATLKARTLLDAIAVTREKAAE